MIRFEANFEQIRYTVGQRVICVRVVLKDGRKHVTQQTGKIHVGHGPMRS